MDKRSHNEKARDTAILHALAMLRFGRGLGVRLVALLNRGDAALLARIASGLAAIEDRGLVLSTTAQGSLRALLADIEQLNAQTYAEVGTALTDELQGFAEAEATFQQSNLAALIGEAGQVEELSAADIATVVANTPIDGALLGSWIDGMEAGRVTRITQAIRRGVSQGQNTDAIVAAIRGTKALNYADGVLNKSRQSAQTVSRTAATGVSNSTAQASWKKNGQIVRKWQFQATLDERTTLTCASLAVWLRNVIGIR